MRTFEQLFIIWGIVFSGAAVIVAVVKLIYRPDPHDDPDNNPYKDDYG